MNLESLGPVIVLGTTRERERVAFVAFLIISGRTQLGFGLVLRALASENTHV